MAPKGAHRKLLHNEDISRWHSNIARGSRVTADVYLRRLGNFCERFHVTPDGLASMGEDELYNLILDAINTMSTLGSSSPTSSVVHYSYHSV